MDQTLVDPVAPDEFAPGGILTPYGASRTLLLYQDETFVPQVATEFAANGLNTGAAVVVIADPARRPDYMDGLHDRRVDVDARLAAHDLVMVDAADALRHLTIGRVVDEARLRRFLAALLDPFADDRRPVYLWSDQLDLLARTAGGKAAVQLEEVWESVVVGRVARRCCSCSLHRFPGEADTNDLLDLCARFDFVMPTERFVGLAKGERTETIVILQQKALALDREVAYRKEVERQLQDALAWQARLYDRERRARLEADEARRAKRDFLAIMSHELRTPLNAIAGYAELLELGVHGDVSDGQRAFLERIQKSQRRLLQMIDDLFFYSRAEAGTVRYLPCRVPLVGAIRDAVGLVASEIYRKDLDLDAPLPDPSLAVWADARHVDRVLTNLLVNAVKFTPPGGRVGIHCGECDERVRLTVRDTGAGIPPGKLEAIFQPFVQVDSRLTREHEGAGLGLAIGRRLARDMGGDLLAMSSPAGGTAFTLVLPRA